MQMSYRPVRNLLMIMMMINAKLVNNLTLILILTLSKLSIPKPESQGLNHSHASLMNNGKNSSSQERRAQSKLSVKARIIILGSDTSSKLSENMSTFQASH